MKRHNHFFSGIFALALLIPLLSSSQSCSSTLATANAQHNSSSSNSSGSSSSDRTVRYLITVGSTGASSITYQNAQGGTEQVSNYAGDWDKVYTMKKGDFVYISAQNQHDYGSVECQIFVNGQVFKESKSDGAYVIADCSGSIP